MPRSRASEDPRPPSLPAPRSFRHSGELGDVLYALASLRKVEGPSLFLSPGDGCSEEALESILPLLRLQPWLSEAAMWDGRPCDVELDAFREERVYWTNLADAYANVLRAHGIETDPAWRDEPWLVVDEATDLGERDVVFARSSRDHGVGGFWPEAVRLLGQRAVFVGTEEEHAAFVREFGDVPRRPVADMLELARLVAGCRLFVGDQSGPHAVAEALKRPVLQETDLVTPNCLFLREGALSVRLASEIALMEPFVRSLVPPPAAPRKLVTSRPLPESDRELLGLPSCVVVHDDLAFLRPVVRAYREVGPVTVFVSVRAWNGEDGRWDKAASEAAAMGAETIVGDWPDESLHRQVALEEMRRRGHRHVLVPDGDEIASPELLRALGRLASADAADVVRVSMQTYWKSPEYRIQPPERLAPVLMVDAQTAWHERVREYHGPRLLVLGPDHGVLHHLSYAGTDERIRRKISTWGHRDEVVLDWYRRVWLGWDGDPLMRDLHPTVPSAYGFAERIERPDALADVEDRRPEILDPEPFAGWPSVSVVIPLHGGEEDVRACLASLEACRDLLRETIVVDDASPDGAAEVVVREFPWATLLRNERNLGFAGTCNAGYAASSGECVVFLNSDTRVPRAGLVRLVESLWASGTVAAAGPLTNEASAFQPILPTYTDVARLDLFARDLAAREADDREVPMLVGFCLACRRSALDDLACLESGEPPFDTRFGRGMFEDNDLCYRLLRAGWRLRLANQAYVHHEGSKTLNRGGESPLALFRRNQALYEAKWKEDLESGYASHLPGQSPEPVRFDPERSPERRRRALERLAARADVSLCMIVRDEERVLGACLDSVAGAFAQTVVVDTGSRDRTVEIARERGAEVHAIVWPESFALARNESLRHARGSWVLWLDADDTVPLASLEAILRAAVEAPEDVVAFVVPVQFVEEGPGAGTRVDHVKLFRNLPGVAFEGRIHEQVIASLRQAMPHGRIERIPGATVLHSGYDTSPEGQAKKAARDERLLALDLAERPDHPFVLFNLGMTAHYRAGHPEAVDWLRRSVAAAGPGESHVRKAYALLAVSLRESEGPEAALAAVDEGLAAVGADPELLFHRGLLLARLGRFEEAAEAYLAMPLDPSPWFTSLDVGILGFKRSHNLGEVLLAAGRYDDAMDRWREALREAPGFLASAEAMLEAAIQKGDAPAMHEACEAARRADGGGEPWAAMEARRAAALGEEPLAALVRLHRQAPGARGPALLLARELLARGDEANARPLLEGLAAEGVAEAAFHLGVMASRGWNLEGALRWMRRAQNLDPGHAQTKEQVEALERALAGAA